jgi:hypothetical protein
MIDEKLLDFVKNWLNWEWVRRNTVIILMSDHGNHYHVQESMVEGILDQVSKALAKHGLWTQR